MIAELKKWEEEPTSARNNAFAGQIDRVAIKCQNGGKLAKPSLVWASVFVYLLNTYI